MEPATLPPNATLIILLDFIGQNIKALIFLMISLVFLIIARKGIAGLVERVIKFNFSWGGASGGVEATAPSPTPNKEQQSIAEQKVSPPSTKESEPVALKEKEEEAIDWFPQMRQAFSAGDNAKAKQAFETNQREEQDADQRHSNEALYLYFLYTEGNDTTALTRIEELHTRSTNDKQLYDSALFLSWCYNTTIDYDKSEKLWQETLSKVTDESYKTTIITEIARLYKNKGNVDQGIALMEERLIEIVEHEQQATLYMEISALEKEKGNSEAAALALEKVVELSPGNREKLFDAAYAQSQEKLRLLSANNYLTLLVLNQRHSTALNNLGVFAGEFECKGKQISLYRQSMDEGSTLAMANMANQLINGGFWKEAKDILDKARVMDNPHENVSEALYRLQTIKNEEAKKWAALTRKADIFRRQVRIYTEALFDRSAISLDYSGVWYTARGDEIHVKVNGQKISGEWTESSKGTLAFYSYKYSIDGTRRNRSVTVTYKKHQDAKSAPTVLGGALDKTVKCYSYFSADQQSWEFFSTEPDEELILTLHRKKPN